MTVKEILEICKPVWKAYGKFEKDPMVSVLLPTFRRAKSGMLDRCIQSVIRQDYQNWELIIVDDASTDGSETVIDRYMRQDNRVKTIRHTYNVGLPAISEYEGFCQARGKYIAFIFDDNVWERDYLDKTIAYMETQDAYAAYGIVRTYYGKNVDEYIELGKKDDFARLSDLVHSNPIANGGVVLRREVLEDKRVGLYDPHLLSVRVCDWMLWKRVSLYYQMEATGFLAGEKLGVILNDSLGNSQQLESNAVLEREAEYREFDLSPEAYGNIDILYASVHASWQYLEYLRAACIKFQNKKWNCEERKERRKRIGFVGEPSISWVYPFGRIQNYTDKYIFRCLGTQPNAFEMLRCDAIVIIRAMEPIWQEGIFRICETANIPLLYYADDCFDNLSEEELGANSWLTEMWSEEFFTHFKCILVTSRNLERHIVDKYQQYDKVIYIPCIYSDTDVLGKSCLNEIQEEEFVICYLGGSWRNEYFLKRDLPVLRKLSREYNIKLIHSDDEQLQKADYGKIECEVFRRTKDSQSLLRIIRQFKPNVLLHSGGAILNGRFKTYNALWNAVGIGSVLVAAKVDPYKNKELKGKICTYSSQQELENCLTKLRNDRKYFTDLYENAFCFLNEEYGLETNLTAMDAAFADIKSSDVIAIRDRMAKLSNANHGFGICGALTTAGRLFESEMLNFTGGIRRKEQFLITCCKNAPERLGVIFAKENEKVAKGSVRCTLRHNETILLEEERKFEDIKWNTWTYFTLLDVCNLQTEVVSVELCFQYEEGSTKVGVFENKDHISRFGWIRRKLGLSSKRRDTLFADL